MTQVDEDGQAVFANGLRLGVAGRSADWIATSIAESIGRATGRTPKTLRVEVVAGDDWERLRHNVLAMREASRCDAGAKKPEPDERRPIEGYNRRLADAHASWTIAGAKASSSHRGTADEPTGRVRIGPRRGPVLPAQPGDDRPMGGAQT